MPDKLNQSDLNSGVETLLEKLRAGVKQSRQDNNLLEQLFTQIELPAEAPPVEPHVDDLLDQYLQNSSEISTEVHFEDVGTVQHVGNGIATVSGLWQIGSFEVVRFPNDIDGLVLNLDHDRLDVIMLGPDEGIRGGDLVVSTGNQLRVPVGQEMLGRVVNALGEPIDQLQPVTAQDFWFLERETPGIVQRAPINKPLQTGIKVIDALLPIGRGQRELIMGDRQTGKTSLAVDTILNQKNTDVLCVYVAIGQKKSSTLGVIKSLEMGGAMDYTTIVVSGPDDPPALRYLAPYAGCTIAEYFMYEIQRDVLVIYDDLSKHANAYRELSLLLRRPPGREAYPGDVFYLHARLLERACKLNEASGGASLTALPVVEIQRGNISAYIPTNLISITDGQIVLDSEMFNKDIKPAVNVGRSVSRVGGAAQTEAMKTVSSDIRLELAQYEEVSQFARFGTDLDESTQRQITRGQRLQTVLTQPVNQPLSLGDQMIVLYAATQGYLEELATENYQEREDKLLVYIDEHQPNLKSQIERHKELTKDIKDTLNIALGEFFNGQNR